MREKITTCDHNPREILVVRDTATFRKADYPWLTTLRIVASGGDGGKHGGSGEPGHDGDPGLIMLELYGCGCRVKSSIHETAPDGRRGGMAIYLLPVEKVPSTAELRVGRGGRGGRL